MVCNVSEWNFFFVLLKDFVIQNSGLDTRTGQNFAQIILSSNIILFKTVNCVKWVFALGQSSRVPFHKYSS